MSFILFQSETLRGSLLRKLSVVTDARAFPGELLFGVE